MLNAIVALREQQLRIVERLDEVCSGIRAKTMGIDQEHPPVALPGMAKLVATLTNMLRVFFNML